MNTNHSNQHPDQRTMVALQLRVAAYTRCCC